MPEWIKPKPGTSLIASAKRLTQKKIAARRTLGSRTVADNWQDDAWDMYDLVGEQRFLAHTLAARMSQARLFVGKIDPDSQTDDPEPLDADNAAVIPLDLLTGNSPAGAQQLLQRLGINLYMAGEGWLVQYQDPETGEDRWIACSVDEVKTTQDNMVTAQIDAQESVTVNPDENFVIRVWRPHPRKSWEADASTRASLPVLRELVGLTMHISAQVDSRLAGAGLLIVPKSAKEAFSTPGVADGDDEFVEALMEAMITPIEDRGSASALVPLVVTVPDEVADKFHHISFSTPLDSEARELRDEAIRRLSLSQDAPPEVLLGTNAMNHWGAYLVQEDVVTTHLEPPLALICDALTTQYLRPALEVIGVADVEQYVIWYDVSHLVVRPNRATEAIALHERGAITDAALRESAGFEDGDAPEEGNISAAVVMALEMVRANPLLFNDPGLPTIVAQLEEVMSGTTPPPPPPPPSEPVTVPTNVPDEVGEPVAP